MSPIYIDCYHYISSKFTLSGINWAELGEEQSGIADSDNVWWLHLVHYVRDIAKSNTQLSQLNVAELLGTLRTLKKFCLFFTNPSTRHFILCAKWIPHLIFVIFILIISRQLPSELYHILRPKIYYSHYSLACCMPISFFLICWSLWAVKIKFSEATLPLPVTSTPLGPNFFTSSLYIPINELSWYSEFAFRLCLSAQFG